MLGVCLGAQLVAELLGATVKRAEQPEIGWFDLQRRPECPDEAPLPKNLRVFHWHGDTFDIPLGARPLASSLGCRNQAFIYRDRVLALQCHLESTRESVSALIRACGDEISDGPYVQSAEAMSQEPDETFDTMHRVLFNWLDQLTATAC